MAFRNPNPYKESGKFINNHDRYIYGKYGGVLFLCYYEINKLDLGRLKIGDLECSGMIRTFSEVIMMFDVLREIESFRVKNVRMFRCSPKEIRKVYSSVLSLII